MSGKVNLVISPSDQYCCHVLNNDGSRHYPIIAAFYGSMSKQYAQTFVNSINYSSSQGETTMKIEISVGKTKYPYLGKRKSISETLVVMFVSEKTGVVLFNSSEAGYSVGDKFSTWDEDQFEVFTDKITLSN